MKMNQVGFLQNRFNRLGGYKVCKCTRLPDGELAWTKHYSVLDLWHSDSGLRFLEEATDMTSPACVLQLDLDENPTLTAFNAVCDDLDTKAVTYWAYSSGGRGYHIEVIIPELVDMPQATREKVRSYWIKKYHADLMKKTESMMILIPGRPNRKTGRPKTLLRRSRR